MPSKLDAVSTLVPHNYPTDCSGGLLYVMQSEESAEIAVVGLEGGRRRLTVHRVTRIEYNTERQLSSIGNTTPEEYAERLMAQINRPALPSTAGL